MYRPLTLLKRLFATRRACASHCKAITSVKTHPCGPLSRGDKVSRPAPSSRASRGQRTSQFQGHNCQQQGPAKSPLERGFRGVYMPLTLLKRLVVTKLGLRVPLQGSNFRKNLPSSPLIKGQGFPASGKLSCQPRLPKRGFGRVFGQTPLKKIRFSLVFVQIYAGASGQPADN